MNRDTLIAIVVTAVITATVTTFVNSVFAAVGQLPITSKLKQTAKNTLTKNVRNTVGIALILGFNIWLLIHDMSKKGPLTRPDVLYIFIAASGVFLWSVITLGQILWVIEGKRRMSREPNRTHQQPPSLP